MEFFDWDTINPTTDLSPNCDCNPNLVDALTVAHISNGVDPLQALLDAQLQAPLIKPFLT